MQKALSELDEDVLELRVVCAERAAVCAVYMLLVNQLGEEVALPTASCIDPLVATPRGATAARRYQ